MRLLRDLSVEVIALGRTLACLASLLFRDLLAAVLTSLSLSLSLLSFDMLSLLLRFLSAAVVMVMGFIMNLSRG